MFLFLCCIGQSVKVVALSRQKDGFNSRMQYQNTTVTQLVECVPCKVEVVGSRPAGSSKSTIRGLVCRNNIQVVDISERRENSRVAELDRRAPLRGLTGITGSSPVLTTIEIEILNRFGIVS